MIFLEVLIIFDKTIERVACQVVQYLRNRRQYHRNLILVNKEKNILMKLCGVVLLCPAVMLVYLYVCMIALFIWLRLA